MELPKEQRSTESIPDNVFQLFDPIRKPRVDTHGTPEELAEYRRLKPLLIKMLAEWEIAKDPHHGCPVLGNVLAPPP